VTFNQIFI